MRIISVATHEERLFSCFVNSASNHKIPLDLLGYGQEWKGFSWRWSLIYTHLVDSNIPDDELLLITDAFDTLILQPAEVFETRFNQYNTELLFSRLTPLKEYHWFFQYYHRRVFGTDPIVNGGTYIGRCKSIKQFIRQLKYSETTDDQRLLTQLHKLIQMDIDHTYSLMYHHIEWKITPKPIPDCCVVTFPGSNYNKQLIESYGYTYTPTSMSGSVSIILRTIKHYASFFYYDICILGLACYLAKIQFSSLNNIFTT